MITMNYELAMAAAKDAANAAMRKGDRKAWSIDDYVVACETFNRLWPLDVALADPSIQALSAAE